MNDRNETLQWLPRFGEFLLASLMVYSCIMHFKFAQFVAGIVPAWMPWRLFWAYFTGVALCVAGISIIVRRLYPARRNPIGSVAPAVCTAHSHTEHGQ
jgi:uncharacterized membrane protein